MKWYLLIFGFFKQLAYINLFILLIQSLKNQDNSSLLINKALRNIIFKLYYIYYLIAFINCYLFHI